MSAAGISTADYPLPSQAPRSGSKGVRVDLGAMSHPGSVRKNNEDSYLVVRIGQELETLLTNLPAGSVPERFGEVGYGMVVADGMGGMAAGEVASSLAVRTLVNLVLDTPDWIMRIGKAEIERIKDRIDERYHEVDAALTERAEEEPRLAGMGTTMTLAYNLGPDLFVGHLGDSRAYFLRGQQLHQLTHDHTVAQQLANRGLIEQVDVGKHELRHILTHALGGTHGPVETEVQRLRLRDRDQVLLCTDGLTDMVDDESIGVLLGRSATANAACEALVERALQNGGKDNVTVLLARYELAKE